MSANANPAKYLRHDLHDVVSFDVWERHWTGHVTVIFVDAVNGRMCPIYELALDLPAGECGQARVFYPNGDDETPTVMDFRLTAR